MNQAQTGIDIDGELTRLAGLLLSPKTKSMETPRACWLDGSECPYGQPGGQFLDRPRIFCRPSKEDGTPGTGCSVIDDNLDDLHEVAKEIQRKEIERALSPIMEEQALSLSGEVDAAADNEKDEKKKGVLKLAATVIKEREEAKDPFIVRIFREDDLVGSLEKELGIKIK